MLDWLKDALFSKDVSSERIMAAFVGVLAFLTARLWQGASTTERACVGVLAYCTVILALEAVRYFYLTPRRKAFEKAEAERLDRDRIEEQKRTDERAAQLKIEAVLRSQSDLPREAEAYLRQILLTGKRFFHAYLNASEVQILQAVGFAKTIGGDRHYVIPPDVWAVLSSYYAPILAAEAGAKAEQNAKRVSHLKQRKTSAPPTE